MYIGCSAIVSVIALFTFDFGAPPASVRQADDILKTSGYWQADWPGHAPLSLYVTLRGQRTAKPLGVFRLGDGQFNFGDRINGQRFFSLFASKFESDPGWNFPVVNLSCETGKNILTACGWKFRFNAQRSEWLAKTVVEGKELTFVFKRTASKELQTALSGVWIKRDELSTQYLHVGQGTSKDNSIWIDSIQNLPNNQLALELGVPSSIVQEGRNVIVGFGPKDGMCCQSFWDGQLVTPHRMTGHWRARDREVAEWQFPEQGIKSFTRGPDQFKRTLRTGA